MSEEIRRTNLQQLMEFKKLLNQQNTEKEELSRIQKLLKTPDDPDGVLDKTIDDFANETYKELDAQKKRLKQELKKIEEISASKAKSDSTDSAYVMGFVVGIVVLIIGFIILGKIVEWSMLGKLLVSVAIGFAAYVVSSMFFEKRAKGKLKAEIDENDQLIRRKKDEINEITEKMEPDRKAAQKALDEHIKNETRILKQRAYEQYHSQETELQNSLNDINSKINEYAIIQPKDYDKLDSLISALENHYAETIPEAFRWINDQEEKAEERARRAEEELKRIEASKPGEAHITLTDSSGKTPMYNSVYIDGMEYGTAPCTVSLSPGNHTAFIRMKLYYGGGTNLHQSGSFSFNVKPGETVNVKFSFHTPSQISCFIH